MELMALTVAEELQMIETLHTMTWPGGNRTILLPPLSGMEAGTFNNTEESNHEKR
jgi:hypothetical protein